MDTNSILKYVDWRSVLLQAINSKDKKVVDFITKFHPEKAAELHRTVQFIHLDEGFIEDFVLNNKEKSSEILCNLIRDRRFEFCEKLIKLGISCDMRAFEISVYHCPIPSFINLVISSSYPGTYNKILGKLAADFENYSLCGKTIERYLSDGMFTRIITFESKLIQDVMITVTKRLKKSSSENRLFAEMVRKREFRSGCPFNPILELISEKEFRKGLTDELLQEIRRNCLISSVHDE